MLLVKWRAGGPGTSCTALTPHPDRLGETWPVAFALAKLTPQGRDGQNSVVVIDPRGQGGEGCEKSNRRGRAPGLDDVMPSTTLSSRPAIDVILPILCKISNSRIWRLGSSHSRGHDATPTRFRTSPYGMPTSNDSTYGAHFDSRYDGADWGGRPAEGLGDTWLWCARPIDGPDFVQGSVTDVTLRRQPALLGRYEVDSGSGIWKWSMLAIVE
ncbi:hypothetical protein V490_05792 [Pseudogymnoascus sp. VKM F-3557]|nr:hypothetical protein V490_05792 [Pseudogymnoascus sp. VKM F-3557]